jgi:TonB family protein
MELTRCLMAMSLVVICPHSMAETWNCQDVEQTIYLDGKSSDAIGKARSEKDPGIAIHIINSRMNQVHSTRRPPFYEEAARINLKHSRIKEAAAIYQELYDFQGASTPVRERARSDLAVLLLQIGTAKEIIALFDDASRPVCGELSVGASFALASALNSAGDFVRAQKLVMDIQSKVGVEDSNGRYIPDRWRLLELRILCNRKLMDACAANYDGMLRNRPRSEALSNQLTQLLPAMRRFPELNAVLANAERDAIIVGNKVMPSKLDNSPLQPISRIPPSYPSYAARLWVTGYVILDLEVNEDGIPDAISVVDAEPPGTFEQAAIDASRQWRFKPNVVDGLARRHRGRVKLTFDMPKN